MKDVPSYQPEDEQVRKEHVPSHPAYPITECNI